MKIKNTRDTLSETYQDAVKIRFKVFVEEQKVPRNLELGSPVDEAAAVHFVLYDDKLKAVGTVRLLDLKSGSSPLIQRMAVLPEARGKGYAGMLLEALLDFAGNQKISELTLHAQLTARGLYAKYGFTEVGEVFEEAGIQHITMRKSLVRNGNVENE